jgi:2-polyprenyl-3-methyl-5-hydroxy-6-metoxy-1,4-benzoquinol methylase
MDYSQTYQQHYQNMNKNLNSESYEKYEMRCIDAYLPANKDARLLDIGCGVGLFVYYLQKKGYSNIEGIDISQGQIDFANANAGVKLKLQTASSNQFLADKVGLYDQIYLMDVLEHIRKEDLTKFLSPIIKALKSGGSLVIRTPNMANPLGSYSRYMDMTHETGFTEHSLIQLISSIGPANHTIVRLSSADHWLRKVYGFFRDCVLTCLYRLGNRVVPSCFDANLLMVFYF